MGGTGKEPVKSGQTQQNSNVQEAPFGKIWQPELRMGWSPTPRHNVGFIKILSFF